MKQASRGFTLLEILIGLALSAVVLSAVYQTYLAQQRSYSIQEEVAKMQQNLRAAMFLLARELRTAGYDPSGKAAARIISAIKASAALPADDALVRFSRDLNGDGDTDDSGEDITYSLYTSGGIKKLGRKNPTLNRPVAEFIEALDLVFLDEDDSETADTGLIRSVQITLVARTQKEDKDYVNNFTYRNQQGQTLLGPAGDGFRRAMLSTQVRCRNLGL